MDIIIRDVEEKDGQYKIYNKDGTGGHWYITKESAEKVSGQIEPQVMPKIADGKRKFTEEEEKFIWWGVQWAFKPENKNRIFKKEDFFNYIYWEMEI